jgi:nickel-dependent lactate racemase
MLGPDVISTYRVVQHDAWAEDNVSLGSTASGHEVRLNGEYMRAKVKILTGFIEPHFFAGFSGGPKAVLPGLADVHSVMANHGFDMIGHRAATWGITEGNPLWEEMREVALKTSPDFVFNVSLNSSKEITGVFAGDLLTAHAEGTRFVRSVAMASVPRPFDIVVTSNSGYPLDLNVYQSVKGMSAAAQIVKPGGSIVMAAECWDGVPEHGDYGELLRMARTPEELLSVIGAPGFSRQDQWQVQIQAKIQMKAQVYLKNSYLDEDAVRATMLTPCSSIEDTVAELVQRYGPDASICVLPEGPMTIPYVE